MFKYVLKRLGLLLMTFAVIMLMCFVLIKLLPIVVTVQQGQDANIIYSQLEARGYIRNVVYDEATKMYSFDTVPVMVQLGYYLKRIFVEGDFGIGVSMAEYRNQPVWDVFTEKLPPTVLINIYSSVIGVPIGLGLGIFAALKKNKWQDQVISVFVILLISLPSIVLGLVIQYVFCFKLGWFPLTMKSGYDYFSWEMFRSMLPAVLSLCLGSIAGYAHQRSDPRTGDVPPCAEKRDGAYLPYDSRRIRVCIKRVAHHREYVLYSRSRQTVSRLYSLSGLRFLHAAFGLLYSCRACRRHHRGYQLRFY